MEYTGPPEPDKIAEIIGWQEIAAREYARARELLTSRHPHDAIRWQESAAASWREIQWWKDYEPPDTS